MNELIAVHYSSDRPTVLGQDLHKMLEVDSNYTTWFRQMCEYGFLENIDFMICFPNLESELRGKKINKTIKSLLIWQERCRLSRLK